MIEPELFYRIAEKFGTPTYVFCKNTLIKNFKKFQKYFDIIAYPYKANSIPSIIRLFHQLGAWADVSSMFELELANYLNAPRILFNSPCRVFVENVIPIVHDEKNLSLNVEFGVRISYKGSRFGIPPDKLIKLIESRKFNLNNLILLHIHIGTNIINLKNYLDAIRIVNSVKDSVLDAGGNIQYIDIGGGFPTNATLIPLKRPPRLEEFLEPIRNEIQGVKLIAEPGRALLNPGSYLLTRVKAVRERWIFVDASTTMLPSATILYHQISKVCDEEYNKSYSHNLYNIVGCGCFDEDIFGIDRKLPEVKEDDLLLIHDAGAYSANLAPQFIELRPAAVMVDDDIKLIMRREGFRDYVNKML